MSFIRLFKNKASVSLNDCLSCNRLQVAGEFLDPAVTWIGNEVEMIGHQNISDQLAGPIAI